MATDGASTQMQFLVEDLIQTTIRTLMVQQEQEAARARPNLEVPATPFRHAYLAGMLQEVDTDNVESFIERLIIYHQYFNAMKSLSCLFKNYPNFHKASRCISMIPIVIEQTGRGERSYDIFSRLLKERIICLMGGINDNTSSIIVAQLLFLQAESSNRPIHMYINSPGGSVTSGLSIYDTMQYLLPPISTWCIGQACSMASLLLSSGTKGLRYSLPNSRIMIHQPSGGTQGQATDIQIQAEEIIKLKNKLNNLYVKHTGLELDKIASSVERDKFMSPEEALEFGLIDKILTSPPKLDHVAPAPVPIIKQVAKDEIQSKNSSPNVSELSK
ncbi:hypothetical protein FQA39_LY15303 [Lamprigera yunnana]|nr:hypothetical protein FQA39_LY15303 [Lamprigera yunnana]